MFDLLLSGPYFAFTLSLSLLVCLLLLEIVLGFVGGSLMGVGADAPGIDIPDTDLPDLAALNLDFDGVDFDPADLELAGFESQTVPYSAPEAASAANWLGFGKMPAMIWLACVLAMFGLSGLVVQSIASAVIGMALPALIAAVPAGIVALWTTARFGGVFAALLPKVETESVSERHLGRRMGVVTQGTASRGRPAEVRVTDRFGNTHHLRAEPLRDEIIIPQGSDVLVLRHRHQGGYLLIPMSDA